LKEKPLFLSYQSSSEEEDDDLGRGLDDVHDMVNWDTMGGNIAPVTVARDASPEAGALRGGRRKRTRMVVVDEEDAEEQQNAQTPQQQRRPTATERSEEGVGPTPQSTKVKGLFD
jgi:hypothetical protein